MTSTHVAYPRQHAQRAPHRSSGQRVTDPSVRFVSATSTAVDGEVRAMVRPRVPNYPLRRLLVGLGAAVVLCLGAVAAVGLLASLGSESVGAAAEAPRVARPSAHVATVGDTMWSIASDYRGQIGHDRYLHALVARNGGPDIRVGQVIWLP